MALSRSDLVARQAAHPPFGARRFAPGDPPVRAGITGSGPDLLLLAWSARDLEREIAAGARVLQRLGVRPGMRVANTLPGALATPGALLLGDVIEAIGALDVPLGTADTDAAARAAWELVDRVRCDVLVLAPDTAAGFLAAAPAAARPWWAGIVWLQRAGAAPAGFAGWQRVWLSVPEVASFVAGSCERGVLHADDAAAGVRVEEGQLILMPCGPAAATEAFDTGIAARHAPCACGANGTAFETLVAPAAMR